MALEDGTKLLQLIQELEDRGFLNPLKNGLQLRSIYLWI
jgi:hypothetical protein